MIRLWGRSALDRRELLRVGGLALGGLALPSLAAAAQMEADSSLLHLKMCKKVFLHSSIQEELRESHQGNAMPDCILEYQKLSDIQHVKYRDASLRELDQRKPSAVLLQSL